MFWCVGPWEFKAISLLRVLCELGSTVYCALLPLGVETEKKRRCRCGHISNLPSYLKTTQCLEFAQVWYVLSSDWEADFDQLKEPNFQNLLKLCLPCVTGAYK